MLINNAGVFSRDNWKLVNDINMTGAVTGVFVAVERMGTSQGRGGRGGTIVNTASSAGLFAEAAEMAGLMTGAWATQCHIEHMYTAAKHGIVGLTRCCILQGTNFTNCASNIT